jgi:hypothetical protein
MRLALQGRAEQSFWSTLKRHIVARPVAGGRGPGARLQQVRAVAGQAGLAQRRRQPAVPHELPAGRAGGRAAGEAARHVGRLAEEVRVVQRERGHHLHALGLLAGQPPAAILRASPQI